MGKYNSSLTRVQPVFRQAEGREDDFVRRILAIPIFGRRPSLPESPGRVISLRFEPALTPPVSLLSWLIRNLPKQPLSKASDITFEKRLALYNRDPATIEEALTKLRAGNTNSAWHIFEGPTVPDAVIETENMVIVIEGKRTETPSCGTEWMPGRHQMWRHLDAAWEIRGHRSVYGLMIVDESNFSLWARYGRELYSRKTMAESFPHRSRIERRQIISTFAGVVTWQTVCVSLGLDIGSLPDTLDNC